MHGDTEIRRRGIVGLWRHGAEGVFEIELYIYRYPPSPRFKNLTLSFFYYILFGMPQRKQNKKLTIKNNSELEIIATQTPTAQTPAIQTPTIQTLNDKFIQALKENKASPEDIAQVLADALYATDDSSNAEYSSRIKAAEMLLKNYQTSATAGFSSTAEEIKEAPTKEIYAVKAWQRACDSSSLKEETKYKYFDILGKVLGYFSDAPNTQLLIYNGQDVDGDILKKKLSSIVGKISPSASA